MLSEGQRKRGSIVNGTHQLLVYADDVNMLCENINTMKTNKEAMLNASRVDGLEVNA
jgi:hypothetical protein